MLCLFTFDVLPSSRRKSPFARLIPCPAPVINLPVGLPTEDWSFLQTAGVERPRCRGTRVLVGQFFSWNSGWYSYVSHESNARRTREEEQHGFVIQRTVCGFCSCFLTIHSRRDVACFHSVAYDEKFDGFSISLTRFSTRERFRFLRIFRFAKHCPVYVIRVWTNACMVYKFFSGYPIFDQMFFLFLLLYIDKNYSCNCRSL